MTRRMESKLWEIKTREEAVGVMKRIRERYQLYKKIKLLDGFDAINDARQYVFVRDVAIAMGADVTNLPKSIDECK